MSNPTELPVTTWEDRAYAELGHMYPRYDATAYMQAEIDDLRAAAARRAQPEGEAPQDVTCARCDGVGAVSSGARTVLCDACNGSGELHPAATLSPLCGDQHAESGKGEMAMFTAFIEAEDAKGNQLEWGPAWSGWIARAALAAQQAAAPGALAAVIDVEDGQMAHIEVVGDRVPTGRYELRAAATIAPGTPEAPKGGA